MKRGGFIPLRLLCLTAVLACGLSAQAQTAPRLDTREPLGFFTNLASRLLRSELSLSLTRIQVYPTNQYTPSVHRLLQVTANVLDATTNRFNDSYPYLPSVFRPLFTNDGGSVFICGYTEVGTNALTNAWRDLNVPADRDALQENDYVSGVPLVIGAKKGFPNFNEFAMQCVFQITRRLQVTRNNFNAPQSTWRTNQMFVIGISNVIGVEAWNSYRSNYTRAVDIIVEDVLTMALTNDFGLVLTQQVVLSGSFSVPATGPEQWRGFNIGTTNSFLVPLRTNFVFLPYSIYRFNPPGFTNNFGAPFETGLGFPIPRWGLNATNRLRCFMLDHDTQRLVDFVTLEGLIGVRDLSEEIRDPDNALGFDGLWSTNLVNNLPWGILNQIDVSFGNQEGTTTDWTSYGLNQPSGTTKDYAIDYFRALYGLSSLKNWPSEIVNTNQVQLVPFTPTKRISQYLTWQANDPLVHYMPADLAYSAAATGIIKESLKAPVQAIKNIGKLNERYQPWGGNPQQGPSDLNSFNLTLKDPLIRMSDDWNVAVEPLSFALLRRVHRGTPWQTVYLKSSGVALSTWTNWTGNASVVDSVRTMPSNDWRLASLIVSLLNTNDPRQLLSVNERSTNAWLAVQDGFLVLTNTSLNAVAQFDTITVSSNSPQAAALAAAIARTRASQSSQSFRGLGDILATPELSVASPWLNLSNATQLQWGITDEAYERIPTQLLPRLRADSIGSLVQAGGVSRIQFTGFDDFPYAVEVSSNLVEWVNVSTNYPTNGVFKFLETSSPGPEQRFYRSMLLP